MSECIAKSCDKCKSHEDTKYDRHPSRLLWALLAGPAAVSLRNERVPATLPRSSAGVTLRSPKAYWNIPCQVSSAHGSTC